jgi:hypothetical protein
MHVAGTIVAVGISNLHAVDMGSSRNIFIVGILHIVWSVYI